MEIYRVDWSRSNRIGKLIKRDRFSLCKRRMKNMLIFGVYMLSRDRWLSRDLITWGARRTSVNNYCLVISRSRRSRGARYEGLLLRVKLSLQTQWQKCAELYVIQIINCENNLIINCECIRIIYVSIAITNNRWRTYMLLYNRSDNTSVPIRNIITALFKNFTSNHFSMLF